MLPDEVLLEIFDFYVDEEMGEEFERTQEWITLVHVCRRWRSIVLQSPRRLNLQLVCTAKTRARDTLDIWPPFPLIICNFDEEPGEVDNIIAALEHNDRVSQIYLNCLSILQLEHIADSAAINEPFPELTDLALCVIGDKPGPILPDSFLGGTAPRLRFLGLEGVPFPGLLKLRLSTTHLVNLTLYDIPPSGYIPPEAMATILSVLTSLDSLILRFRSPRPRPALASRRPPPPPLTRAILSGLNRVEFKGTSEYLEVILARIDAPQLDEMYITIFNEVVFDTPQLFQFISRTPTLKAPEKSRIAFSDDTVLVKFPSQKSDYGGLRVHIPCTASGWQLSAVEQVCTSSFPPVSTLKDLYVLEFPSRRPRWQDDVESTLWLDLLRPFVAVKNLHISKEFVPRIAPALEELVGVRTTEVLPTLENIFLAGLQPSGPLHEGIEKFVAARELISHPVAISRGWNPEENEHEWYNDY